MAENSALAADLDPRPKHENFLTKGLKKMTGKSAKTTPVASASSDPVVRHHNSRSSQVPHSRSDPAKDGFQAIGYESVTDSTEPTRGKSLSHHGPSIISLTSGSGSFSGQNSHNRASQSSGEPFLRQIGANILPSQVLPLRLSEIQSNSPSDVYLPSPEIQGLYEPSAYDSDASFSSLDPKNGRLVAHHTKLVTQSSQVSEQESQKPNTATREQGVLSPSNEVGTMSPPYLTFSKNVSSDSLKLKPSGSPKDYTSNPAFVLSKRDTTPSSTLHSFEVVNSNVNLIPPADVVDALFKNLLSSRVFPLQSFQNVSTKRKWELLLSENETNPLFDLQKLSSQLSGSSLTHLKSVLDYSGVSPDARPFDLTAKASSKLTRKISFGRTFSSSFTGDYANTDSGTLGTLSKKLKLKEGSPSWFVSRIMANKLTTREFRKLVKKLESKGSKSWLYEFQDSQGITALSVILQRINKRSIKSNDDIIREQHICHCLKVLVSTDRRENNADDPVFVDSDDELSVASKSSYTKSDLLVISSIMHSLLSPSSTTRLLVTELLVYLIHCSRYDYFPHIMDGFVYLQDSVGDFVRYQPWLNVFETAIDQHFNLTAGQRSSNEPKFKNYVLTTLILINMMIQKGQKFNDRAHTRKDLSDSRLPIIFNKLGAMKDDNINQQIEQYEDVENDDYSKVLSRHQERDFEGDHEEVHTLGDIYSKFKLGPGPQQNSSCQSCTPTSSSYAMITKRLSRLESSKPQRDVQKIYILLEAILDHAMSNSNINFDPDSVLLMSVERLMDRMETDDIARRAVMEAASLRKTVEKLTSVKRETYRDIQKVDLHSSSDTRISLESTSDQNLEIQRLKQENQRLQRALKLKVPNNSSNSKILGGVMLVDELELKKTIAKPKTKGQTTISGNQDDDASRQDIDEEKDSGDCVHERGLPYQTVLVKGGTFSGSTANAELSSTTAKACDGSHFTQDYVLQSSGYSSGLPSQDRTPCVQNEDMLCTIDKASRRLLPSGKHSDPMPPVNGSSSTVSHIPKSSLPDSSLDENKGSAAVNEKQSATKAEFLPDSLSESASSSSCPVPPPPPPPPLPASLESGSSKGHPPPPPPLPAMLSLGSPQGKSPKNPSPPPPPPLTSLPSLLTRNTDSKVDATSPPPPPPLPPLSSVDSRKNSSRDSNEGRIIKQGSVNLLSCDSPGAVKLESHIKPKTKLKQMHWSKIDNIDNTFWSNVPHKEIIDELHLKGILEELEKAFVAKNSVVKVKTKTENPDMQRSKKISLLPRDLAQQFGINLHMFGNLSVEELMSKILRCDESITENVSVLEFFNSDALNEIPDSVTRAFFPYSQDYSAPERKPLKSSEELERADRIFLEIFNMRSYWKSRSRALLVLHSFKKDSSDLLQKLDAIHRGAKCIQDSENLKLVLALIRSVGNFMNDSSKQALGFKIDILQRLKFMKDDSNSMTFLHYVEKIVRNNFPEYGSFVDELSILNHTQRISVEQLEADCEEFKRNVMNVATSITKGNLSEKGQFHPDDLILSRIKNPLEQAKQKVFLVDTRKDKTIALYCEVMDHYGENSLDSNSKNFFFAKFSNFVVEFKKVHAENVQKEEDERIYERKKQMIERKENALKERNNERNRQGRKKRQKGEDKSGDSLSRPSCEHDEDEEDDEDEEYEAEDFTDGKPDENGRTSESIDDLLCRLKYRSPMPTEQKLRRAQKGQSYLGLNSLYSYSIENLAGADNEVATRRQKSSNEYESVKSLKRRMTTRRSIDHLKKDGNNEQYDVVMLRAQAMLSQLRSKTSENSLHESDITSGQSSANSILHSDETAPNATEHNDEERFSASSNFPERSDENARIMAPE